MSVPIIHTIDTGTNITLSAIQGKISRIYNTSTTTNITVTYGSNTYQLGPNKYGDFWYNGTTWIGPDQIVDPPRQNLLINSNFDLWQEATSLSSGSGIRRTSDGSNTTSVGTTYYVSREDFTIGQTTVPNGPIHYKRIVTSSVSGASNFCIEQINTESLQITSGKKITLSLWIKADATKNVSVEFVQFFGAGGSSEVNTIGVKKKQITSSWARYTFTADMPSISGKTIGSTPGYISAVIWLDAGSTFNSRTDSLGQQSGTFDIAQTKLEIGDYATDWEPYDLSDEIKKCQRYIRKTYNVNVSPGTSTTDGVISSRIMVASESNPHDLNRAFNTMAYTPAITWYSPISGNANSIYGDNPAVDIVVSSTNYTSDSYSGYPVLSGSSSVIGSGFYAHFVARAYL